MRPEELASDSSKTIDAVIHAIMQLKELGKEFDDLVLLQPTQPLRTSSDIDNAIEAYYESGCEPLASVSAVDDHPLLIRSIDKGILQPILDANSTCRRQDMPPFYRINGCIYINEVKSINVSTSFNDNRIPFVMDKDHSVDIDDPADLVMAKYFIDNQLS